MRIEHFGYTKVKENGTFKGKKDQGQVHTEAIFRLPDTVRGKHIPLSKRQQREEGHFICIGCPRTKDGTVQGVTIYFDTRKELLDYLTLVGEETYKFSETNKIDNKTW